MIVTRNNFLEIRNKFLEPGYFGLDTETTGLRENDELFSFAMADDKESYYFNFMEYDGLNELYVLKTEHLKYFREIFLHPASTWFMHNAKFDMKMMHREGIKFGGTVHCTQAQERVLKNNYFGNRPYSLDSCAKRRGHEKDSAVEKYITKHKLFKKILIPGKKKAFQERYYYKVPIEIMQKYCEKDALLTREIGMDQLKKFMPMRNTSYDIMNVVRNERKLTKTLFTMERRGLKIDRAYVEKGLKYEIRAAKAATNKFEEISGAEWSDSSIYLGKIFDTLGEPYPRTKKGNPSFAKESLEGMETPLAQIIKDIRVHEKYAGTYYSSFLHYSVEDTLHAEAVQGGTEHGRMSYREPNLQNVPKEEKDGLEFYVRKSFVPRDGKAFVFIDYDAMEFKFMVDYAGQLDLIKQLNEGHDPHQATADLVGISRKEAKTLNFGLLYGMGPEKLGKALGIKVWEAKELRSQYFSKLPKVKQFLRAVMERGKDRGFVYNWLGRRCAISHADFAYILPNHIISGGCADAMKVAMNEIDSRFPGLGMLLQVHDELVFEVDSKVERMSELAHIMEKSVPSKNGMKFTCSVEHSFKSWGHPDKIQGLP